MTTLTERLGAVKLDIDGLHALVCIEIESAFPKLDRRGTKLRQIVLDNYESLGLIAFSGTEPRRNIGAKDYALTELGRAWMAAILVTPVPRRMYVTPAGNVLQPELDTDLAP